MEFSDQYACAREERAGLMADQIINSLKAGTYRPDVTACIFRGEYTSSPGERRFPCAHRRSQPVPWGNPRHASIGIKK